MEEVEEVDERSFLDKIDMWDRRESSPELRFNFSQVCAMNQRMVTACCVWSCYCNQVREEIVFTSHVSQHIKTRI